MFYEQASQESQDPNKITFGPAAKEREIKRSDQNSGELGARKVVKQDVESLLKSLYETGKDKIFPCLRIYHV